MDPIVGAALKTVMGMATGGMGKQSNKMGGLRGPSGVAGMMKGGWDALTESMNALTKDQGFYKHMNVKKASGRCKVIGGGFEKK